jgi:hypothetical protein
LSEGVPEHCERGVWRSTRDWRTIASGLQLRERGE